MSPYTKVILSGDHTAIEQLLAKAPLLHIRRFAVFCALDALATTRCSDVRLHLAVQTIRRYVEGGATREELQHAAGAANAARYATTYTAAGYAAAYAASAAWYAASAAGAAAGAARVARYAAYVAWCVAGAAWPATGAEDAAYAAGYAAGAGYVTGAAGAARVARQRQADAWARITRGEAA